MRDYLVHYGYADTLAAFDSAAGAIPGAPDDDMGQDACVLSLRSPYERLGRINCHLLQRLAASHG